MDLREYYRRVAEQEESIDSRFPLIVSLKTANGGKAGVFSEVSRPVAARMVVDGQARLATHEETVAHLQGRLDEEERRREALAGERLRVALAAEKELLALKAALRVDQDEA
ncbi:MAG: hypothetical protein FJW30_24715 [Acidobacteria bacterium]|nr:hypothetical protein [Acidobacteriota bacterium]